MTRYGWRHALLVFGLVGLPVALLVRFTLREPARGELDPDKPVRRTRRRSGKRCCSSAGRSPRCTFWRAPRSRHSGAGESCGGCRPSRTLVPPEPRRCRRSLVPMNATAVARHPAHRVARLHERARPTYVATHGSSAIGDSRCHSSRHLDVPDRFAGADTLAPLDIHSAQLSLSRSRRSACCRTWCPRTMRGLIIAVLLFVANVANLVIAPAADRAFFGSRDRRAHHRAAESLRYVAPRHGVHRHLGRVALLRGWREVSGRTLPRGESRGLGREDLHP